MIVTSTIVKNVDNSGARLSKCINISKLISRQGARAGNVIKVLVKWKIPKRHIKKKSKIIVKGQIYKAIVVHQRGRFRRWGHFQLHGSQNSVVLLNEYDVPYATRIFGIVFKEVRHSLKYRKIITLAKRVF